MERWVGMKSGVTRRSRRARGFTLIELMVAVAVIAILATVAAPSFQEIMHRNRLTAAANEYVAALQTARMEAIRRNRRAVLCPTTDGAACLGTDWTRVLVFVDTNSNGTREATEEIVRDVQVASSGTGLSATSAATRIWFGADGRVSDGATRTASVSLVSSKLPVTENGRMVQVATSRVNVCTTAGSATTCNR